MSMACPVGLVEQVAGIWQETVVCSLVKVMVLGVVLVALAKNW